VCLSVYERLFVWDGSSESCARKFGGRQDQRRNVRSGAFPHIRGKISVDTKEESFFPLESFFQFEMWDCATAIPEILLCIQACEKVPSPCSLSVSREAKLSSFSEFENNKSSRASSLSKWIKFTSIDRRNILGRDFSFAVKVYRNLRSWRRWLYFHNSLRKTLWASGIWDPFKATQYGYILTPRGQKFQSFYEKTFTYLPLNSSF
jgi:hypothetical protein